MVKYNFGTSEREREREEEGETKLLHIFIELRVWQNVEFDSKQKRICFAGYFERINYEAIKKSALIAGRKKIDVLKRILIYTIIDEILSRDATWRRSGVPEEGFARASFGLPVIRFLV